MRKKDLIIKLIEQDLRHNYLLKGLQKIGLQTEDHYLEIIDIVARLMGKKITDEWSQIYFSYLEKVSTLSIPGQKDEILWLATDCFKNNYRLV